MAELIPFPGTVEEPDIDSMTLEELTELLDELTDLCAQMDATEPEAMEGDEFEAWAQRHEELEDLIDDVVDRIEELC